MAKRVRDTVQQRHIPPISHFRPHPWHGLEAGPEPPEVLNAFIEITPFDMMKYEVDKVSGYLRVDRPQRSSAQHPALYGFVPRTYCGERVCRLAVLNRERLRKHGTADRDDDLRDGRVVHCAGRMKRNPMRLALSIGVPSLVAGMSFGE